MDWKPVPKVSGSVATQESITLCRDKNRKGLRLYIPDKVRKNLGDPQHYFLNVEGSRLMLQFTERAEEDTRKVSKGGYVRIPMQFLGFRLKKGVGKESIMPEIHEGNLFVDLGKYLKVRKEE